MDFDSLRCFDAAATTLNFRSAALRVGLSPAAFSDRVRRLEQDLGATLFVRTTRQVELSEVGRRLLPLARSTLISVEHLQTAVRSPTTAPPHELYVGTRYELGISWLCPALPSLARSGEQQQVGVGEYTVLRLMALPPGLAVLATFSSNPQAASR